MKSSELRTRLQAELTENGCYRVEKDLMECVLGIIESLEDEKDLYHGMLSETQRWQLENVK